MSAPRFSTEALDEKQAKPAQAFPWQDSYSAEWRNTIAAIGLSVVVVSVERGPKTFKNMNFFKVMGEDMKNAGLGHHVSSQWNPIRHHFYVQIKRMAEAIQFLKAGLDQRGLLEHAAISYFDQAEKIWRLFQPGQLKT